MSQPKFSPAPWGAGIHLVWDANGELVAICPEGSANSRAHAKLVAAAPELLAACETLLFAADKGERAFYHAAAIAKTVIAKATQSP